MAEPPPTSPSSASNNGFVGRVRGASISLINANPQLGIWQAAGTAIAQAPNLTELRDAESGGDNIAFNAQGHSARFAVHDPDGELTLVRSNTRRPTFTTPNFDNTPGEESVIIADVDESIREVAASSSEHHPQAHWNLREKHRHLRQRRRSLYEKHKGDIKEKWGPTIANGLMAFWKFFKTPAGFFITLYCLNIVVCHLYQHHQVHLTNVTTGMGCKLPVSHTESSPVFHHDPRQYHIIIQSKHILTSA